MVALLAVPITAAAQTEQVSNFDVDVGNGPYFGGSETNRDWVAQGFTTGASGYRLEKIEVRIKQWPLDSDHRGAFPISRSRAHTHRRHGHPLQTVPSAGLIERPQEKNRVDALR